MRAFLLGCFITAIIAVIGFFWFNHAVSGFETLNYGRFQNVIVRGETVNPSRVVLFASESKAMVPDVDKIAKALAADKTLVIWVDVVDYLKRLSASSDRCVYPAGDFEMLSQFIQRKQGVAEYQHPVVVGHGPGATLAYVTLAEAPQTFPGAISIDFCPDFHFSKLLCEGKALKSKYNANSHTIRLLPSNGLTTPWIVLQTQGCTSCDHSQLQAFVDQMKNSFFYSISRCSRDAFLHSEVLAKIKSAVQTITAHKTSHQQLQTGSLADLPLVEVLSPASHDSMLAVIVSGDGGWAGIDSDMGDMLSARGIPVVGLDSLNYFWTARTPDEASHDLERIIDHYSAAWNKPDILLIGYSRGADVLPFMVNRLPGEMQAQVKLLALLGLSQSVSFEFHLTDWLSGTSSSTDLPILPEITKLKGMQIRCFCGEEEKDSLCPMLDNHLAKTVTLKGGHHFGGNYTTIIDNILSWLK